MARSSRRTETELADLEQGWPEICEFYDREVQVLKTVIVLPTYKEKHVAKVTFKDSVEGVCCLDCVPEN